MDPATPPTIPRRSSITSYIWVVVLISLLTGALTTAAYIEEVRSLKLDIKPLKSELWALDASSAVTLMFSGRPAYPKPRKPGAGGLMPVPDTEFKQYRLLYKSASAARKDAVVGVILQGAPVGGLHKALASKLDPKRDALELQMWQDLLVRNHVEKDKLPAYLALAKKLDVGPWSDGLLFGLYAAAGDQPKAEAAWERLRGRTTSVASRLGLLGLGTLIVLLTGLVLLIIFLVGPAKRLHGRPPISRLDGRPLIKAFLVYFLGYNVLSAVPHMLMAGTRLEDSAVARLAAAIAVQIVTCWLAVKYYYVSKQAAEEEARWEAQAVPALPLDSEPEETAAAEPAAVPAPQALPFRLDSTAVKWAIGGFCVSIVLVMLSGLATNLIARIFGFDLVMPEHPLMEKLGSSPLSIAMAIATAAIAAPITEEIAFRGFFFGSLRTKYGFWAACLLSSAVFAIIHPTIPAQFLGLMALGMVFCVLREKTGNLAAPMIAHGINNLVMFIVQITILKPW